MKDYFLRAQSREQIDQALTAAGLLTIIDDEPITSPEVAILDYIGQIPEETGRMVTDEDGFEYPEMVLSAEYHANLRGAFTQDQLDKLPIIPWPKKPYRIPAGGLLK